MSYLSNTNLHILRTAPSSYAKYVAYICDGQNGYLEFLKIDFFIDCNTYFIYYAQECSKKHFVYS